MALSNYQEEEIIKHLLRTGSWTKPTTIYVSLHTAATADDGTGTEVSGGSYARVAVTVADAQWTAPSAGNGRSENVNAVTFPAPTANWGTITHAAIFDAASGGNMLVHGALQSNKTVNNGDAAPEFAANALAVVID